jgi:hypothetical protein
MSRPHRSRRRVHPLRAIALMLALPVAAWSAVDAPHLSSSDAVVAASPPPVVPAPRAVPVRKLDARTLSWRRLVVQAHVENTLKTIALSRAAQQRTAQWDELARCENGGDWSVVDRYGGGLGIFIGTWHAFGGDEFASNPGYATKEQQIIVAERIYARHGLSGWGCKVHMSWR